MVGGGLLGMTIAHRLAQRGEDVTVLEAAESLGGLAATWQLGPVTWDRHYHVTLLSDRHTRGLLDELGLAQHMCWVETRTGCYTDKTLYPVSDAIELLRFPPLRTTDRLRLGATILYGSKIRDGRRLEDISATDWLRTWSGSNAFERFWLPLLRSKLGESYRETSAAFIWATIRRLSAARRTGMKKELFGYAPGGYANVLSRFAGRLADEGVTVALRWPVQRVATAPRGTMAVTASDGRELRFDQVIVTAAPPIAARLCQELTQQERARLEAVRYQGIVCASLLLSRPLSPYYLTYITDGDAPFTGVVEMTAFIDRAEVAGHSLIYLPKYLAPDDPFLDASDEEVRQAFVPFLARMHPELDDDAIVAFRVSRARHVFAIPTIGYSTTVPPITTSIDALSLVSSANIVNNTLNANETIGLADRAVGEILSARNETREAVRR